eukprot:TRINITY_DN4990_c0_g1_i1.p1 TRINITY_DN4990_c0_g1~~TRINITY_DN4990_c0_g1_i1.p1  ORF type:complete len:191 (-),score=11.66 TRINITY_DN4990_c0_g1_i1:63-596(-)
MMSLVFFLIGIIFVCLCRASNVHNAAPATRSFVLAVNAGRGIGLSPPYLQGLNTIVVLTMLSNTTCEQSTLDDAQGVALLSGCAVAADIGAPAQPLLGIDVVFSSSIAQLFADANVGVSFNGTDVNLVSVHQRTNFCRVLSSRSTAQGQIYCQIKWTYGKKKGILNWSFDFLISLVR